MAYSEAFFGLGAALDKTGAYDLIEGLRQVSPVMVRHSWRVAHLAMFIGCSTPEPMADGAVVSLGFSGALHDVGKQHPDIAGLVESPVRFTDAEAEMFGDVHTREGSLMIRGLPAGPAHRELIDEAAHVALRHHVRPPVPAEDGLSPATASAVELIHTIDMFDAMQDPGRCYRRRPVADSPATIAARLLAEGEVAPFQGLEPENVAGLLAELYPRVASPL